MTPQVYVDLRVLPLGEQGIAVANPRTTGLVFGAVHRCFRQRTGRFAVAFPQSRGFLSIIRVFASSRDDLDELAESLSALPSIRDYASLAYPRTVPIDYAGPWLQYRRYRIPSRAADRHAGAPCRARRILEAEKMRLPYLLMHSTSTQQNFGLRFEIKLGQRNETECHPDGYGFARANSIFSLPDLPI